MADPIAWAECPCCGADAVPNSGVATQADLDAGWLDCEDVEPGDPLWSEDDEADCPACGCHVTMRDNGEFMEPRAACYGGYDDEAAEACPCCSAARYAGWDAANEESDRV